MKVLPIMTKIEMLEVVRSREEVLSLSEISSFSSLLIDDVEYLEFYRYDDYFGESYEFGFRALPTEDGKWEIEFYTTRPYDYCIVSGKFTNCQVCYKLDKDTGECLGIRRKVSDHELVNLVCERDYRFMRIYISEKQEN